MSKARTQTEAQRPIEAQRPDSLKQAIITARHASWRAKNWLDALHVHRSQLHQSKQDPTARRLNLTCLQDINSYAFGGFIRNQKI